MSARAIVRVAGALLLAAAPLHAQLVANGGFEAPVVPVGGFTTFNTGSVLIPGWTVVGAPGNVAPVSTAFVSRGFTFPAHGGVQWMDLTGLTNSPTGIEQAVATVPGTTYELSFWVGNIVDPSGFYGSSTTIEVLVDGAPLAPATNVGGAGTSTLFWQQFLRSFTATESSTTITFLNLDPSSDNSNGLDDVVLTEVVATVPEPGSLALVGLGLAVLLPALRRRLRR